MIYLDNAATTGKKPPEVIRAVDNALRIYSANPGRGGHKPSMSAFLTASFSSRFSRLNWEDVGAALTVLATFAEAMGQKNDSVLNIARRER